MKMQEYRDLQHLALLLRKELKGKEFHDNRIACSDVASLAEWKWSRMAASEAAGKLRRYKIVRFYERWPNRLVKKDVSLHEAQLHCQEDESSSKTCKQGRNVSRTRKYGNWFDGYEVIKDD